MDRASGSAPKAQVRQLAWEDEALASISLPKATMQITRGVGSGLAVQPGQSAGTIWAIGDRGPNLKVKTLADRYGVENLAGDVGLHGAKVMPCPDLGPALIELRLSGDMVEQVRVLPIRGSDDVPISGLPIPSGVHAASEPALDLAGKSLGTDPSGADTEGLIAVEDGFWVGDEYGPSLLRLDSTGRVLMRWVPAGTEHQFQGTCYPVEGRLPALAARRHINRGFEAIGLSPDGRRLHLAFQSPLAHPDRHAHEGAAHVRIWTLDAESGAVLSQHLYPLDPPERFRRDVAKGEFGRADIKLSELIVLGGGRLLCLERGSASTKLYLVALDPARTLPLDHLAVDTRPTVEQISAQPAMANQLPVVGKTLLLDTDDHPDIGSDLEGMVQLAADELLLVSDNDFGVEGAETGFWRVKFDQPLAEHP